MSQTDIPQPRATVEGIKEGKGTNQRGQSKKGVRSQVRYAHGQAGPMLLHHHSIGFSQLMAVLKWKGLVCLGIDNEFQCA